MTQIFGRRLGSAWMVASAILVSALAGAAASLGATPLLVVVAGAGLVAALLRNSPPLVLATAFVAASMRHFAFSGPSSHAAAAAIVGVGFFIWVMMISPDLPSEARRLRYIGMGLFFLL